jgi:hypothetical protein
VTAAPAAPKPNPAASWERRILYEDEQLAFEWWQRTPAATTVAVTFDPIQVGFGRPAYAADFLQRAGIDTLCVRKKDEHFYQPLSRELFDRITKPILAGYGRRLAYGSSLGAYAVLYFCREGFDTVIASSPRVSAHPRFGATYWQERVPFQHLAFAADAPASSGAVVFYDPHDPMDRRFVDEELRPAWPLGNFVAVPFAGHPANQFLAEIGFITPFVRALVAGNPAPALQRRSSKSKSFTYRQVLAAACLRHAKPRWAEQLSRQALQMKPAMANAKRTLGEALLAQGRLDEAEPLLNEFLLLHPLDGEARQAMQRLTKERARREGDALALAMAQLSQSSERGRAALQQLPERIDGLSLRLQRLLLRLSARLHLTVSRDDIAWCYRHLLGREPESEQAYLAHGRHWRFKSLVRAIVESPEYGRRTRPAPPPSPAPPSSESSVS